MSIMHRNQDLHWRVTLQTAADDQLQARRMLEIFTSEVDLVDGRTIVGYFRDHGEARNALAAQFEETVVAFELSRWDDRQSSWTEIDRAGGLLPRSTTDPDRIASAFLRVSALFPVFFIGLFLAAYFIPGASGTPAAGRHHDLGRALVAGLIAGVVGPAVLTFTGLDRRRF